MLQQCFKPNTQGLPTIFYVCSSLTKAYCNSKGIDVASAKFDSWILAVELAIHGFPLRFFGMLDIFVINLHG